MNTRLLKAQLFIFLTILGASFTTARAAEGKSSQIKLLGLYNMAMVKNDPADSSLVYTNQGGIGGGASLELGLGQRFTFEIGAFYTPYLFKVVVANLESDITSRWNMIHIPALFRLNIGSVVSLGVGGYYGLGIGKAHTEGTLVGVAFTDDSDLSDNQKSDYGALGSLEIKFRLGSHINLVFEGRYLMGMKNVSSSTTSTQKISHVQGLAGLGITL